MSLLIFAFICLLVLMLVCWLIQSMPMGDPRIKWALQAIAVVLVILLILNKSGMV